MSPSVNPSGSRRVFSRERVGSMQEKPVERADAAVARVVDYAKLANMSIEELLYYVLVGDGRRTQHNAGAQV